MKQLIMTAVLLVLCFNTSGCGRPKDPVTFASIGTLIRVDTSGADSEGYQRCRIVTDKGSFAVIGDASGITGEPVWLASDGHVWLGKRASFPTADWYDTGWLGIYKKYQGESWEKPKYNLKIENR